MRGRRIIVVLSVVLLFGQPEPVRLRASTVEVAHAVYIAPWGDDTASGTKSQPLRTLEAARDAVRKKRKTGDATGMTVWLRGGVYERERTFELTDIDSGTADAPMIYRGYPEESVRLVGGKTLHWSWFEPIPSDDPNHDRIPRAARDRVLRVDLAARGITDYGPPGLGNNLELFCDDQRMVPARWPNDGWATAQRGSPYQSVETEFTFDLKRDRPRQWQNVNEVFLHGYWRNDYRTMVVRPSVVDPDNGRLTLAKGLHDGPQKKRRFYAFNVIEELDRPGEWHLDRPRGTLYLFPPNRRRDSTLTISLLATPLIKSVDTSFLTIRDLTLKIGRSDAIYLIGGEHNRVAGCTVRNVGGNGIVLHGGKKSGVVSSDLYDLGRGGVVLMGGDRKTLDPGGLFVENSHIHHYSQVERAYLPAVHLRDGIGNRATHNLIHDAPHCGILYSGNDHRIEFNELHHLVLDASDAGVLYSGFDWTSRGNIIRHNFFHDIPHLPGGYTRVVYLDDAHSSTATIGNVFYRTHQSVWIGGGRDNRVENNVFIDCDEPVSMDNRGLRWTFLNPDGDLRTTRMYKKLIEISHAEPPWSERYPKLARILNENPRAPVGNTLKRNLYVRSNWRDPEAWCREHSPRHVTTKYMDIVDNFATEEDPGFVDAKSLNFALRSNAVVYEKIPGFQPIPFERIGLYVDEYRIELPLRR